MRNINMTTVFEQITKKKFLLPLGSFIIGGSIILGFANQALAVDVPAGPIWSNDDAKRVCPAVCTAAGGTWNGQWTTVIEGKSSVCGCD
jgi:hypothetical protein